MDGWGEEGGKDRDSVRNQLGRPRGERKREREKRKEGDERKRRERERERKNGKKERSEKEKSQRVLIMLCPLLTTDGTLVVVSLFLYEKHHLFVCRRADEIAR